MPKKSSKPKKDLPLEQQLWKAADKLRKNMDAAEYKHVVLGLIFLKYISIAFEERHLQLKESQAKYGADPEDPDEYRSENVFFVPEKARWSYLQARAKLPTIGKDVDEAMDEIEKVNTSLKGVLPKVYAKENLDKQSLGGLIDLVSSILLADPKTKGRDLLGHVYEYFLGQFALSEGKGAGQFYTPRYVVQLLVEMLEPYHGRVFDPCCGSGGMFIQSENFVTAHQGRRDDISLLGQESNQTTWRLCKMNLALHNIDSTNILWNNEGSFLNDLHKDQKADFVLANPPFNDSDWSGELLKVDARWKYGTPPPQNANYAWIQHFIYHLKPSGTAGFVLAKGSLSGKSNNEDEIRKNLLEAHLIDCVINLPTKLFLNTQIPVCLWFISRAKSNGKFRNRQDEILFIDARNLGHLINRKTREFSNEDIYKISTTYHNWRNQNGKYVDIPGFCKSSTLDDVKEKGYVLTPGRYIGLPDEEDDFDFNERFNQLKSDLEKQFDEEIKLNAIIKENLSNIKLNNG